MKLERFLITTIAIELSLIMVVPSITQANVLNNQSTVTLSSNGIAVTMNSNATSINMNNHVYSANWNVYSVNSSGMHSGMQLQEFSQYSVSKINNANQITISRVQENSNVKIAQIFSIGNGYVDASIAVENLVNTTATFEATFVLTSPHAGSVDTFGLRPGLVNIPLTSSKRTAEIINSSTWSLGEEYMSLGWQQEMSLFHSGLMVTTPSQNIFYIPFGPFSLLHNSTYSIDPTITANHVEATDVSPPTQSRQATTDCLPCVCTVCGGGGGTGPAGLSISVSPVDTTPGSSISVSGSLSNYGSGGVSFAIFAQTFGGSWNQVGGWSSTTSFAWNSAYGYEAIQMRAENSYGSTTSNTVSVHIFNYPETSSNTQYVYNTNSVAAGAYVLAVNYGSGGTDPNPQTPDAPTITLDSGTIANWSSGNSIGIWSFNSELSVYGSYGYSPTQGAPNPPYFGVNNLQNSISGSSNDQLMTYLMTYLYGIANSWLHNILPPLTYFESGSIQTYSNANPIPIYFNNTGTVAHPYNTPAQYFPIDQGSPGLTPPTNGFGTKTTTDQIYADSSTSWYLFLDYSVDISFLESVNGGTLSSSTTLIFQMPVSSG